MKVYIEELVKLEPVIPIVQAYLGLFACAWNIIQYDGNPSEVLLKSSWLSSIASAALIAKKEPDCFWSRNFHIFQKAVEKHGQAQLLRVRFSKARGSLFRFLVGNLQG